MLFVYGIAYGQIPASKTYFHKTASFDIDSIFVPVSKNMPNTHPTYMWLNTLNAQYVDTTTYNINSAAVPTFHEIKRKGLMIGSKSVKKQMNAGLYYHPHFYQSFPYSYLNPYSQVNMPNMPYVALPYNYSSYTIKATTSPYYILPKY